MTNKYYFHRSKKIIFFIILFIIAIICVKHFQLQEIWQSGLILVEDLGIWGSLLYILIYNVATLLFVPGSHINYERRLFIWSSLGFYLCVNCGYYWLNLGFYTWALFIKKLGL